MRRKISFSAAALFCLLLVIGCDFYRTSVSITIYDSFIVGFNFQDGSSVYQQIVEYGSSVYLPVPTRSGYTFNGWYSSSSGGYKYGNGGTYYTVYNDVTMYAQWTATITFDSQGGSSVQSITEAAGSSVYLPVPTRSGYTFNGWYSSSSGGTKYNSTHTISGSVTMYAQWSALGANGSGNDGDQITINGIACVLVKAGTFLMGDDTTTHNERPQHTVILTKDFWISKYPITQAQYQAVTGSNPSYFSGSNNPVEQVTWYKANDFCEAVGGRLPTEAEWEFAARGGNKSEGYIYSGGNNLDEVGWYWDNIPSQSEDNSGYGTQPVGTKQPNELGIYDMSGNVFEWCNDWYGLYPTEAVTNPTGPSTGNERVSRGGHWFWSAHQCDVTVRISVAPSFSHNLSLTLGFRVVFPRQ